MARTVNCIKLGREAEGLDLPPYPGALGQRIFENVSKEAWQQIAPGKTGQVTATYNAATIGPVHKSMNVKFAGIDEVKNINFTGEVLSAEDFAKLAPPAPAAVKRKAEAKKATTVKKSTK